MNLGFFSGRLGRDAELNRMASGDQVLNFSVAIDIGTRDNPKTLWVECALFGKRAESLAKWLTKGLKVTVTGRITMETFTSSKDGQTKTALKLAVNDIDMHLPPRDGQQPAARPAAAPAADDRDDEIPF